MISDRGDTLTMVGSDDGAAFWSLHGRFVDKAAGKLVVDFSPKGGPSDLSGVWAKACDGSVAITWSDGNIWNLLEPTADSELVPVPACDATQVAAAATDSPRQRSGGALSPP